MNRRALTFYLAFAGLILSLLPASLNAAARGRAQVQDGNLVADNGMPLRAAPFFVEGFFDVPDMQANEATWRATFNESIRDYHMNAIRICPWFGMYDYDFGGDQQIRDRYIYLLDTLVDWCEEEGVYAIINLHSQFHAPLDYERWTDFWEYVAPEYADRTHVIYEANNEPLAGDIKSRASDMYWYIRNRASDTHIIMWSPSNPQEISLSDIQNHSSIDYSNASVGFHIYEWTLGKQDLWDHAKNWQEAGYPIVCTEFFSMTNADFLPIDWNHVTDNIATAEARGISWMQWAPGAHHRNVAPDPDEYYAFSGEYLTQLSNAGIPHWPQDTGGSTGGSDSVSWNNAPSTIPTTGSFSATVNYSAAGSSRDIVLEVFSGDWSWLGQTKVTKSANSSGTATLTYNISGSLTPGNIHLKAGIRPEGGQWNESIQDIYVDTTATSSGGGSDDITFDSYPDPANASGPINITVGYTTGGSSRDIVFEVFNSSGSWVGQTQTQVNANSSGSVNLSYTPASPLPTGASQFKISIRPVGGSWQDAIEEIWRGADVVAGNSGTNYMTNGSFESNFSNWDAASQWSISSNSQDGNNSANVNNSWYTWLSQTVANAWGSASHDIADFRGQSVTLSFWARNQGSGALRVGIQNVDDLSVTNDSWQQYSLQMTIPSNSSEMKVFIEPQGGNNFIDKIELTKN